MHMISFALLVITLAVFTAAQDLASPTYSGSLCVPSTPLGSADNVLGQLTFETVAPGVGYNGLSQPVNLAVDPVTQKIFVADLRNSRILRFSKTATYTNGGYADEVIWGTGNPLQYVNSTVNSTTGASVGRQQIAPHGLAIDANGRMWASDAGANRILRWDNVGTNDVNTPPAVQVLGQPDYYSVDASVGATAPGLYTPTDLAVGTDGTLYVSDVGNNRVVYWKKAARAKDGAAHNGQIGSGYQTVCPASGTTSSATLGGSDGLGNRGGLYLALDSNGALYASDYTGNRVLRFPHPLAANPQPNLILGADCSGLTTNSSSFFGPTGLVYDAPTDTLLVADSRNGRILFFNAVSSASNYAAANFELGQVDFLTAVPEGAPNPPTGGTYGSVFKIVYDRIATGSLFVVDELYNRVLRYCPTPTQ
jgi:sugar lactone lactonase YvrE